MKRERAGRPGVTWGQQPTRVETLLVEDGGEEGTLLDDDNSTPDPSLINRAGRRAAQRAQRRKGGRR